MKIRCLLALAFAVLLAPLVSGVTHHVFSAADFNNLPTLNSRDQVILHSGIYGALNKTLVSTIADDATAQSDPIFVYAEVNGGVDITAPSQITLQGRGIVLAGLDFIAGSGMLNNGAPDPAWIIRTAADSRYISLSNLRFLNANAGDDYGNWLYLEGFNHTVEYCHFEAKTTRNATIALKRNTAEAGITTKRNHAIRFCYFGPRECSTTENGFETIRIGDSGSQAHDMNVTVERNVFYRAIWRNDGQKPNDLEIISNKSRGNRILNNTFLESFGQITLRHGDACLVEGNYIFGGGFYSGNAIALNAANPHQSGVRIIGVDHVVRNNYIINLAATGLRAALCLMGGDAGFVDGNGSGGDNGYEVANNASIYNNTFIDCREMNLGLLNAGSTVSPTGVRIYNNVWQGSGSSNGLVRQSGFTPAGSGANYIYHPSGTFGWTGLTGGTYSSTASPQVTESYDNYQIPTANSPLLQAASSTLVATTDVRGVTRPSAGKDIGSFEREVAGSGLRPLLRAEVGPGFAGGPSGTYPDPNLVDTQPVITTSSLPAGQVGTGYAQTLAATGGELPLGWSVVAGTLPAGLSLSPGGVLSGTPSTAGTSNFTAQVADLDGDLATKPFSLVINALPAAVAPTYSPSGGTFTSPQVVSLTSATAGASIRYTTNGTTPTSTTGTLYTGPITISSSLTLRALAYRSGFADSGVASASYTISSGSDPEIIPVSAPDSSPWDTAGANGPANLWDGSIVDGGNDSRWASNASPDTLTTASRYVVLDLGASFRLSKFVVHPYASRAYHHEIHVSPDGVNWGTAVVNVQPAAGAASYTHAVNAVGRFVRLKIDGITGTATTWASINEFDLFGTPDSSGTGAFVMTANQVVMEAENATARSAGGGKSWSTVILSGASGSLAGNALEAGPNTGTTAAAPGTETCRADYAFQVPSGSASTFYLHLRSAGPTGSDDSVYVSLNGSTTSFQTFTTTTSLGWKTATSTLVIPAGTHTLSLWMREDGVQVDKVVLSSSSTLPTGTGPQESTRL